MKKVREKKIKKYLKKCEKSTLGYKSFGHNMTISTSYYESKTFDFREVKCLLTMSAAYDSFSYITSHEEL